MPVSSLQMLFGILNGEFPDTIPEQDYKNIQVLLIETQHQMIGQNYTFVSTQKVRGAHLCLLHTAGLLTVIDVARGRLAIPAVPKDVLALVCAR